MNLAFGVLFLWWGAAAMYVATHGLGAATPWAAFIALINKLRGEDVTI